MKMFKNIVAMCVLAVVSNMAVALPIEYRFEVDFTTGPMAGTTAPIFVTLEGVRGAGAEIFRQDLGNLLAFRFALNTVVSGTKSFDLGDALDYRPPKIGLQDGKLVLVEGGFNPVDFGFITTFDYNTQGNRVRYIDRYLPGSTGHVNAASWPAPDNAVPAPASLALLAIGLAGLGLHRRKRAERPSN